MTTEYLLFVWEHSDWQNSRYFHQMAPCKLIHIKSMDEFPELPQGKIIEVYEKTGDTTHFIKTINGPTVQRV